jgi:hypothetical protein
MEKLTRSLGRIPLRIIDGHAALLELLPRRAVAAAEVTADFGLALGPALVRLAGRFNWRPGDGEAWHA